MLLQIVNIDNVVIVKRIDLYETNLNLFKWMIWSALFEEPQLNKDVNVATVTPIIQLWCDNHSIISITQLLPIRIYNY